MSERVNPSYLHWFHQPKLYILSADKLILETEPYTSMQNMTIDENSGFGLFGDEHSAFEAEIRLQFGFRNRNDECGMLLKLNDDSWFKFGVSSAEKEFNELFCTRFHQSFRDRNLRVIGSGVNTVWLRLMYTRGRAAFSYSLNGDRYITYREITFPDYQGAAAAGIYACSPGNSYFDCTFSQMEIKLMEDEK
ncbi:MAG: DUF1349 domain-containing protein [Solobacterium sp.]|nr:DUF1349 domain-containing protein [Solobacterium sp.]